MASKHICIAGCVAAEDNKPQHDKKEIIKIRATLFFDGTLNNMFNTDDRKADQAPYHLYGEYKDKRRQFLDPKKDATSYGNDYSNVALLKTYLMAMPDGGYIYLDPIYVEGIGTINHGGDDGDGFKYGTGDTGIVGKVNKGIDDLKGKLSDKIRSKDKTKIKELRLDVFGFSRGAAAARHFVQRMLNETEKDAFHTFPKFIDVLRYDQYDIDAVRVYFVGLFDTVSSYGGLATYKEHSNVDELHLDAIEDAEATFHIASADEHRRNFALTDITSAKEAGKGKEIFLPGVHCDIGGSYQDRVFEYIQVADTDYPQTHGNIKRIEEDINALISQGWFKRSEIVNADSGGFLTEDPAGSPFRHALNHDGKVFVSRRGKNKQGIRNLYCRIPLHLMKSEAMKHQLAFLPKIESRPDTALTGFDPENNSIPPEIQQAYTTAVKYARDGINRIASPANAALLKILRHDYFHFSADWKEYSSLVPYAPYAPRMEDGKRKRKIHTG